MTVVDPERPINQEVPERKWLTEFLRTENGLTITEYAIAAGFRRNTPRSNRISIDVDANRNKLVTDHRRFCGFQ